MVKYGMKNTFDLMFRDGGEIVIFVETAKEVIFSSKMGRNKLTVVDALIDMNLINDIFSGKHYFKNLSVVGESFVRDSETGIDKRVLLTINEIELTKCTLPTGMDVSVVTLEFEFPTLVEMSPNLTFNVEK